jgi:CRP/FNR family transcriptional regulator, cyclic AMP receptor protein
MDERCKREFLASSPLFENLYPAELTLLSELIAVRDYPAGEVIFREDDPGDSLYVIAAGEVEIVRKSATKEEMAIVTLKAPHFFGEMALIDKEPRSATVRARSDAQLLQLTNENLHIFAKNYRNGFTWVVVNIARVLSSRLRDVNQRLADRP